MTTLHHSSEKDAHPSEHPEGERLQKILAAAGVGSRRACEVLISEGRVSVDGEIVTTLGTRVHPTAKITVDGERVHTDVSFQVIAFNKPEGVVCSMKATDDRPCIADYTAGKYGRLYHVGRLDTQTSGLLLLTNNGELAHHLMHPSFEIAKTYLAMVQGRVSPGLGKKLHRGITLEDGPIKVDSFKIKELRPRSSLVELVIHSGRNRIVRRLMAEVGHPVSRLVRTRIGAIGLDNLRPGAMRPITGPALAKLMEDCGL